LFLYNLWKIFFFKKKLIAAVPTDAKSSENVTSIYKIATVKLPQKSVKPTLKVQKTEEYFIIATVHNRRKNYYKYRL
jgi:hypothetical protein